MFKRFIRLWQSFCKFILAEKKWCWPSQSDVLVLDATLPSMVLVEFLEPWSPKVLHMRGEQFNIPVLLASFFKRGSLVNAYVDCYIEKVRPRLLVTFMDTYVGFYSISKRHPDVKTLFVQNAMRNYFTDIYEVFDDLGSEVTSNFFVDYMMVLGPDIGKKYSQYIAGEIVEMGSIKNNLVRKEKSSQQGVIALVSQWRDCAGFQMKGDFCLFEDFWTKPDSLVVQCLMQYAKTKNKQLMIIPNRLKNLPEDLIRREEDYYRELLGSEPEILYPSGPYPAYQAVDSAEIVVSLDSTLGLESIARGGKAAIFPIRGPAIGDPSLNFGWPGDFPDEGLFWTNSPNPESFVRILDYLFAVDDEQWRKDVEASNFSSILAYDPGNSIFKETLEKILGTPPSSKSVS